MGPPWLRRCPSRRQRVPHAPQAFYWRDIAILLVSHSPDLLWLASYSEPDAAGKSCPMVYGMVHGPFVRGVGLRAPRAPPRFEASTGYSSAGS